MNIQYRILHFGEKPGRLGESMASPTEHHKGGNLLLSRAAADDTPKPVPNDYSSGC